MRPDSGTNEEVPGRCGPEILAGGQDWTRRVRAGHAARRCDEESSAARWAEGDEGPGVNRLPAAAVPPGAGRRHPSAD